MEHAPVSSIFYDFLYGQYLALFSSCLVAFDLLTLQLICYNLKMDTKFRESFSDQTIISDEILNGCLMKPMGLYRV